MGTNVPHSRCFVDLLVTLKLFFLYEYSLTKSCAVFEHVLRLQLVSISMAGALVVVRIVDKICSGLSRVVFDLCCVPVPLLDT